METLATEDRMECHKSLLTSSSKKEHYLKTLMKKALCILYSLYGLKYNARKKPCFEQELKPIILSSSSMRAEGEA